MVTVIRVVLQILDRNIKVNIGYNKLMLAKVGWDSILYI